MMKIAHFGGTFISIIREKDSHLVHLWLECFLVFRNALAPTGFLSSSPVPLLCSHALLNGDAAGRLRAI
jgi:hypothetical protein